MKIRRTRLQLAKAQQKKIKRASKAKAHLTESTAQRVTRLTAQKEKAKRKARLHKVKMESKKIINVAELDMGIHG